MGVINSRRGSTMVEATMVLPLLILSIITCMLVCMFFYDTTIRQCQLHRALRCEACDITGLTTDLNRPEYDASELSISSSRSGVFHTVTGKEHSIMINKGILRARASEDIVSLWHAADGVSYVRYCTIAKTASEKK